jgi:hypothetical protein
LAANPGPVAAQSAKAIAQKLVVIFHLIFEVMVFSAKFRIEIPSRGVIPPHTDKRPCPASVPPASVPVMLQCSVA